MNDRKKVTKPLLGRMKLLHQAVEEEGDCMYCGKPMRHWKGMEECPGKLNIEAVVQAVVNRGSWPTT